MIKKEWHWMLDKEKSIIKEKNLSDSDVWNIVNEWYGMYPDILQDENGLDLEEICYLNKKDAI
jgi:hypothetical protein